MEIWDLYNEKRQKTGRTHIRGEVIPEGYFHLVVHVWLRLADGRFLMSKRAPSRPSYPLMWECTGGSVTIGEDSYTGAVREVFEEVGIDVSGFKSELLFTKVRDIVNGEPFRDIMDVWCIDLPEGTVADLSRATTDEVAECRPMNRDEIYALFESGEVVPTLGYIFDYI